MLRGSPLVEIKRTDAGNLVQKVAMAPPKATAAQLGVDALHITFVSNDLTTREKERERIHTT